MSVHPEHWRNSEFCWKEVDEQKCELTEVYECCCGGHVKFDVTYLDQVGNLLQCPYCGLLGSVGWE